MAEKDTIFSSKIKHVGIFSFKHFYRFCYDWLKEETQLDPLSERKYEEKIVGDAKEMNIEWKGERKITDYFKFEVDVKFTVRALKDIEINQGGAKIKTNQGSVKVEIKGVLVRDYDGKFETTALKKFMRSIYEKWVIPTRIEEYEGKLASDSDEFLSQIKAYLDLEGKR
ncbi:MAG TPA: hypothetical protein ENH99_00110 [Candidatus Pacearchaeota archaeon]|nr:hypothetical protein [Candidatus Pacearchaeota archaeon]